MPDAAFSLLSQSPSHLLSIATNFFDNIFIFFIINQKFLNIIFLFDLFYALTLLLSVLSGVSVRERAKSQMRDRGHALEIEGRGRAGGGEGVFARSHLPAR